MDEQIEYAEISVNTRSDIWADEGTLLTAPSLIARVCAEAVSFVCQRSTGRTRPAWPFR